jgi:glucan phosphorylase
LDPAFVIYARGLGILAGDHMKSAGDLHLPAVGIGLLWSEGSTRRPRWLDIMRASVAMSQWRFSSDRQVEDDVARMYAQAG